MLVTLPVLQQNFTAGSGGARALVSAVTWEKTFRCFWLVPEEFGREHVETLA
jgi:hypothetical protein